MGRYTSRKRRLPELIFIALLPLWVLGSGCERGYEEETTLLERAEANFTAGEYDIAEQLYRQFLMEHPRSPYVPIASQRLRLLDRELEVVMGRRGTLTPVRVEQRLPQNMQRVNEGAR